jgi:hypothetical protein
MPHALTDRQRDYLEFLKEYIYNNEDTPSLTEIADNFEVSLPVAHKTLQALMDKGYLYFERSSEAGFFVRLIERAGAAENVMEVPIAGTVDQYGEVVFFEEKIGSFPAILPGAKPDSVGALVVTERIAQASMQPNDFIIFDIDKNAQPADIFIGPIGQRLFLLRVGSKTFDKDMTTSEMAQDYPIPETLSHPEYEQKLNWYPLAYSEKTDKYFVEINDNERWPLIPFSPDWVLGTAIRLTRSLRY